ncbi:hypothetical protein HYFRA_00013861, partial [Hymenoscyphus fraxineus]
LAILRYTDAKLAKRQLTLTAGIMNIPIRTLSTEGYELHLATNYLGLFLFTNLLISALVLKKGVGRVVNVASDGYRFSPFRFGDWNFEGGTSTLTLPENEWPDEELCRVFGVPRGGGYIPTIAYAQSKTAVVIYSGVLGGRGVECVSVHPGAIKTDLWRHIPKEEAEEIFRQMSMKSLEQGISTILVAALDPKLGGTSNVYLEDCQVKSIPAYYSDPEVGQRLWKLTEELVGEEFRF